tara:strand:- start:8479 stop:8766 length:288 start_codon:yes stop_codon:yes gene_type:complete
MKHISNKLSKHIDKKPYTDKELFDKNQQLRQTDSKNESEISCGSIVCFRRQCVSRLQIVGKVVAITENDYIIETSPIKGLRRHSVEKSKVRKYGD